MKEETSSHEPSRRHEIDLICDEFESRLKSGETPVLVDYLEKLDSDNRSILLRELVLLQREYDPASNAELGKVRAAYPDLTEVIDHLEAAISETVRPAEEADEGPDNLGHFDQTVISDTVDYGEDFARKPKNESRAGSRFHIIRPHARGGLGEVFVANDAELNREVALKEIRPQFADHSDSRNRFVLEAEVTGGLEHPGIVPVYGLGQHEDGRPYYAMRFIRGDSLRDAVKEFHQSSHESESDRSLKLRQLLGRFIDVCQAISYAHSRGVLHRDLKPGNIMLGKYGETLVVDWGLAKVAGRGQDTNATGEEAIQPTSGSGMTPTVMGSAVGTPAYMPPEQAAGRLDELGPASDVYSLGATLYHLLTGVTPFAGKSLATTLADVQKGNFPPPRNVKADIPKSLEAICLRAMALEAADRYGSPTDLAEDVERFLADEPVHAFTEPLVARARRWVRRHPTLVTTTAAIVLVSVIGLAGFSSVVSDKNKELANRNSKLIAAEKREREAKETAQANEQLANTNAKAARQQSQLALETLTSVISDIQAGLKTLPGGKAVRSRLLKTALAKLDEVSTQYVDQSAVDKETMRALASIGYMVMSLGVDDGVNELPATTLALRYFQRAHTIAEQLAKESEDSFEAKLELGIAHNNLGNVQLQLGDTEAALQSFTDSLSVRHSMPESDKVTVQYQEGLAKTHVRLAEVHIKRGKTQQALADASQAVRIGKILVKSEPNDMRMKTDLSIAYNQLGDLQLQMGDTQGALKTFSDGLEHSRTVAEADKANVDAQRDLSVSYEKLGNIQVRMGNLDAALETRTRDLKARTIIAEADPENMRSQRDLAVSYNLLGEVLGRLGRGEEAIDAYKSSLTIGKSLAAVDTSDALAKRSLAIDYAQLAKYQLRLGKTQDAFESSKNFNEIAGALVELDKENVQSRSLLSLSHQRLGNVQAEMGDLRAALASYTSGFKIDKAIADADKANVYAQKQLASSYEKLGRLQLRMENPKAALDSQLGALEISQRLADADKTNVQAQRRVAVANFLVAEGYNRLREYDKATKHLATTQSVLETMIQNKMNVAESKWMLGQARTVIARIAKAKIAIGNLDELLAQPPEALPDLLERRCLEFAARKDFAVATQAATKLCELENLTSDNLYNAACVFALGAASIIAPDGQELSKEQSVEREQWIQDGMSALTRSVKAGWTDMDHLRKDSDLTVLRELPEFKALIE